MYRPLKQAGCDWSLNSTRYTHISPHNITYTHTHTGLTIHDSYVMMYQALAELPREHAEEVFVKISMAASRSARLGIFNLECSHRFHQTLTASASLGKGKIQELVAAESILNAVRQHHKHTVQEFLVCAKTYCRFCGGGA